MVTSTRISGNSWTPREAHQPEEHELTTTSAASRAAADRISQEQSRAAEESTGQPEGQPEHGAASERGGAATPRLTLGQQTMKGQLDKLQNTRKLALNMKRKTGDVKKHMADLHGVLSAGLAEARIRGEIGPQEEKDAVEALAEFLNNAPSFEHALDTVIGETAKLGEHNNEGWGEWSKRKVKDMGINPRVAGAVCLGLGAMAAKNGAWYLPSLISAKNIPFESVSAMTKVFFKRWATANVAAGAAEYPASTIGQRIYKSTGNSLNEFMAVLQLGDMVTAYAALKITGQQVSAFEGMGLASVVVATLIRSGLINNVWDRFASNEQTEFAPINLSEGADDAALVPRISDADAEAQPRFADLPAAEARAQAKGVKRMLESAPDETWEAQMKDINSLSSDMHNLQSQLVPSAAPIATTEQEEAAGTELGDVSEMLQRVQDLLNGPEVQNYQQALDKIAGPHAEGATGNNLDDLRNTLKGIQEDLEKQGGKDPKTIGFAIGMLMTYTMPIILGNVGQLTNVKGLQSVATRGALNIIGSVSAQTAANLGHFLVKENKADSDTMAHIKKTAVAIGITPAEFIPLILGLLFMDKAGDMSAAMGDKTPWPRPGTLRVIQELGRSLYTTLFTNLTMGTAVTMKDIVGISFQAATAAAATALDHREAVKDD